MSDVEYDKDEMEVIIQYVRVMKCVESFGKGDGAVWSGRVRPFGEPSYFAMTVSKHKRGGRFCGAMVVAV